MQPLQLVPAIGDKAAAAEPRGCFVKVKSHFAVHAHHPGDDCAEEIYFIIAAAAPRQRGIGSKHDANKTVVSLHGNIDVARQSIILEALGTEILVVNAFQSHIACVDVESY